MSEHTPTPWDYIIVEDPDWEIYSGDETVAKTRKRANACFICLACNNFNTMREALQAIKNLCDGYTELDKETCSLYIGKILSQIEE